MLSLVTMYFVALLGCVSLEVLRANGANTYENTYDIQIHWITVLALGVRIAKNSSR